MKSKFILTAFFCVCGIMPMAAQWQRTPTPNDTLQSVKVLSDGRIALNIYAPQAKKVDIEGDIIPWGKKPDGKVVGILLANKTLTNILSSCNLSHHCFSFASRNLS